MIVCQGSIPLNGTARVTVSSDQITTSCRVILKVASGPLEGTIVISEVNMGGFGFSSTSPKDVGVLVYFEVVES
jgi:hypothetical protein